MTTVLLIGNSDDKLTQFEWSNFYDEIKNCINNYSITIHFNGYSNSVSMYQNACFVFNISSDTEYINKFIEDIKKIKIKYKQNYIVIIRNETEFI
jgi:phosphoserine aminotransferase